MYFIQELVEGLKKYTAFIIYLGIWEDMNLEEIKC